MGSGPLHGLEIKLGWHQIRIAKLHRKGCARAPGGYNQSTFVSEGIPGVADPVPFDPAESEWLTRKRLIDPRLKAAGWRVVPFDEASPLSAYDRCAIKEYPTDHGPADYALCVAGEVLGVVEAKKLTLGPQGVLPQAERYSRGIKTKPTNFRGYGAPFLYSTNGEVIWHHDIRHALSRSYQIAHFHTPDALADRLTQDFDAASDRLLQTPNDHYKLRPYQQECNTAIERAIADRKRLMLIAMATGTGKTFTMVNQVYRLMKAGVAKRILFLVDRRALAAQAVQAFASFDPEPGQKFDKIYEVYSQRFHHEDFEDQKFDPQVLPTSYLTDPQPGSAFVYVSTIQRMTINLFGRETMFEMEDEETEDDAERLDIPIHAFDLVIADECHRGYTAKDTAIWRWRWVRCQDICDQERAITYGVIKLGPPVEEGIPTLRSSDVRWLWVDESQIKRISPRIAAAYSRTFVKGGEILVTVRGSLGGVAVVPAKMAGFNISREVAMLPVHSDLDPRFFSYAIACSWSQAWLAQVTIGVAYTGINIRDLKRLPLPLPPLEEQREIVRRVEALFKLAEAIEKRVAAATARADKLTQAILAKAFRGELVSTEAELARRENHPYEPASTLLARIENSQEISAASGRRATRKRSAPK